MDKFRVIGGPNEAKEIPASQGRTFQIFVGGQGPEFQIWWDNAPIDGDQKNRGAFGAAKIALYILKFVDYCTLKRQVIRSGKNLERMWKLGELYSINFT